jgi:hypothetical protein
VENVAHSTVSPSPSGSVTHAFTRPTVVGTTLSRRALLKRPRPSQDSQSWRDDWTDCVDRPEPCASACSPPGAEPAQAVVLMATVEAIAPSQVRMGVTGSILHVTGAANLRRRRQAQAQLTVTEAVTSSVPGSTGGAEADSDISTPRASDQRPGSWGLPVGRLGGRIGGRLPMGHRGYARWIR